MKVRDKNPVLKRLVEDLKRKGDEKPFWRALARALNRPGRKAYRVNLSRIERHAGKGETVVVPGDVLSLGELKKPVTVVALRFSKTAEEKIKKSGGESMLISDFMQSKPKVSGVRIMG